MHSMIPSEKLLRISKQGMIDDGQGFGEVCNARNWICHIQRNITTFTTLAVYIDIIALLLLT